MGLPEPKPASYVDLFDLPEHIVGEIINGRLVTHPRPAPKHAVAYSVLGGELQGPFDRGRGGPGGWWILDEPEIHLMGDILVPDIAGWRRERMPRLPAGQSSDTDNVTDSAALPVSLTPNPSPACGRGELNESLRDYIQDAAWFDLAPDWLREILSPSTARVGRAEKLPIYARWGVSPVWLVDPDLRTLEAYENQSGRWVLLATMKDDEAVSLPPFDAISFSLGGLWAD
jgi:Uma2 family endonuclease